MMIDRRDFLRKTVQASAALTVASVAPPALATFQITPYHGVGKRDDSVRRLSFYQTHTGERMTATFFANGEYDEGGLASIDYILRDHRTGDVQEIDRELLQLLYDVKTSLGTDEPFQVFSGYRSPQTNAMLAAKSEGVDTNSYHMRGQAIDVRIQGVQVKAIRELALEMQRGGVGYYRNTGFVHLDRGPVREWIG